MEVRPDISAELLDIQANIESGFTLKRVRAITKTCSQGSFGFVDKVHF